MNLYNVTIKGRTRTELAESQEELWERVIEEEDISIEPAAVQLRLDGTVIG